MPEQLTWQAKYLRRQCGLSHEAPMIPDPDDPAGRELTTKQAAAAAHVPESTIRSWKNRKQLAPVNDDPDHPLYLELDVLGVEAATCQKPRERRLISQAAAEFGQAA